MPASLARLSDRRGGGQIAAYLVLCVVWGSTFLAIRVAVETLPPWTMIACRCLVAGGLLASVALLRGAAWPGRTALGSAALSGVLLFACSQALLSWSELRLPSGEAAVLVCTGALFTPVASWLLGASARPGGLSFAGLAIGFLGVAYLVRPELGGAAAVGPGGPGGGAGSAAGVSPWAPHAASEAAVLCSSLCWAVGAAVAKRVRPAQSALLGSGLQLLAGGVAALAFAGLRGEWVHLDAGLVSARSVLAVAYLIVMGSLVAYACFGWLVHLWRPEVLSTYGLVNPVVALALGALLAGEAVGGREMLATAVILCGVGLVVAGNRA